MRKEALRRGDLVEVGSRAEILETLDDAGALDGVPFMPEMIGLCGRRFEVDRRGEKVCDTINTTLQSRRLPTPFCSVTSDVTARLTTDVKPSAGSCGKRRRSESFTRKSGARCRMTRPRLPRCGITPSRTPGELPMTRPFGTVVRPPRSLPRRRRCRTAILVHTFVS